MIARTTTPKSHLARIERKAISYPSELAPDSPCTTVGMQAGAVLGICPVYCSDMSTSSLEQDRQGWTDMRESVAQTYAAGSMKVKVFKFRSGEREADSEVYLGIMECLQAIGPTRVELVDYQPDPNANFQAVRGCTHFISARYHGAMFPFLASYRMLFVPYHRKVSDLAAEVDLSEEACLPLDRMYSREEITARVEGLLGNGAAHEPRVSRDEIVARAVINRTWAERFSAK